MNSRQPVSKEHAAAERTDRSDEQSQSGEREADSGVRERGPDTGGGKLRPDQA